MSDAILDHLMDADLVGLKTEIDETASTFIRSLLLRSYMFTISGR